MFIKSALLLALAAIATAKPPYERIVGGAQAERGQFPYQVQLQNLGSHYCGGAILNANWIITANHCATSLNISYAVVSNQYNILVQEGEERRHGVARIIRHPAYDGSTFQNDIALMKMNPPMVLDDLATPIRLPPQNHTAPAGTLATVSGWGSLIEGGLPPRFLRFVQLPIVSDEFCDTAYTPSGYRIAPSMICAYQEGGGKDACQGDSGGPLVADDLGYTYLAGVVSWGIGCARPEYPGVYTEVSHYIDWIEESMAAN